MLLSINEKDNNHVFFTNGELSTCFLNWRVILFQGNSGQSFFLEKN